MKGVYGRTRFWLVRAYQPGDAETNAAFVLALALKLGLLYSNEQKP